MLSDNSTFALGVLPALPLAEFVCTGVPSDEEEMDAVTVALGESVGIAVLVALSVADSLAPIEKLNDEGDMDEVIKALGEYVGSAVHLGR